MTPKRKLKKAKSALAMQPKKPATKSKTRQIKKMQEIVTLIPGNSEIYQDSDPVTDKLIEIRSNTLTMGDVEAIIGELQWYLGLRDSGESIPDNDRIHWEELDLDYRHLSDEQISKLIDMLNKSENGDYINQ